MLISISMILLMGMFMGWICKKIHLPSLMGMLLTGIILGPYFLNMIDDSIFKHIFRFATLLHSSSFSTRAGLSLDC